MHRPRRSLCRAVLLALAAPLLPVVAVTAAAPASAAGVQPAGTPYAVAEWTWGDPSRLPDEPYRRVEVTYGATYGITMDGVVRSAVDSFRGSALVAPAFDRPIVDVTASSAFGVALDDQGHLHTWGAAPELTEADLAETYRDVAAADGVMIAVTTTGQPRYWGPQQADYHFDLQGARLESVDVDSDAAVALTTEGRVLSAGGGVTDQWFPEYAFPADRADERFVAVDAGVFAAVALTDDGEVVAWGVSQYGQHDVPAFPEGRHAVAVSAGMWMDAAVLDDGSVVRWGVGEHTVIPTGPAGARAVDIDLDRYRAAVVYAALVPSAPATLTTTPTVGEPVGVDVTWSEQPDALSYAWTVDGTPVSTAATYTPAAGDLGRPLAVTVTAERTGYVAGTATASPMQVEPGAFSAGPTLTVSGTPTVGSTLKAVVDDSVPKADSYDVSWYVVSADARRASTAAIAETGTTLRLTPDLIGQRVAARVVAHKEGYSDVATSNEGQAPLIGAGTLAAPRVRVSGSARVGVRLSATVTADPAAEETTLQWLRAGAPITGATGPTYTPVAADLGRSLSVRVTSTAAGYGASSATSVVSPSVGLPAARLRVATPPRVAVGRSLVVRVRGLARGERFTVRVGSRVLRGLATVRGAGTVRLTVTGRPGRRTVTVVGSRPDRTGRTTLRVVRR